MTYETMNMTWRGIEFTLAYDAEHFPSANIAHIEIRCRARCTIDFDVIVKQKEFYTA